MNSWVLPKAGWRPPAAVWVPLAAVAAALAVGALLLGLMGVLLVDAVAAFADGAWGSAYAMGTSINRSLAFALVGLGFVLAQRAN